jgi:hypothetical protein
MPTFEADEVLIIESVRPGDTETGRLLFEALSQAPSPVPSRLAQIATKKEFFDLVDSTISGVKQTAKHPKTPHHSPLNAR